MFRRFVVLRPPRLRLLGEAPFGDSVRRMGAGFDGIVTLCCMGTLPNTNPFNDRLGFNIGLRRGIEKRWRGKAVAFTIGFPLFIYRHLDFDFSHSSPDLT